MSIKGLEGPIFDILYCEFQPVLIGGSVKSKPFPSISVHFISRTADLLLRVFHTMLLCGSCHCLSGCLGTVVGLLSGLSRDG